MSVGKALTIADMIAESSRAEKPRPMIRTCSIWRALEVVGDTPTLLILEAIWFGQRRFDSIRKNSGLQKALISNRLKRLTEAGLLRKQAYTDSPPRFNYVLTDKGLGLYWTSLMLLRWEQRWATGKKAVEPRLTHKT
ncbi:MAG: helix-turn-helix transcriptional regulator, partial [Chromatiales bacterium]|nr:helix-turn-helix transcriptional regulator [Chromatiales bacterium]